MVARPSTYAAGTGAATGRGRPAISTDSPMLHDVCGGCTANGSYVSRRTLPSSDTRRCSCRRPPSDHGVPELRPPDHCPTLADTVPNADPVTAEMPATLDAGSRDAWNRRTAGTKTSDVLGVIVS